MQPVRALVQVPVQMGHRIRNIHRHHTQVVVAAGRIRTLDLVQNDSLTGRTAGGGSEAVRVRAR